MSRRAKGPRLWLRPARKGRTAAWFILDGGSQFGTGATASDLGAAEQALTDYLAAKHLKDASTNKRDTAVIPVADVLAIYARDIAPNHSHPKDTAKALRRLGVFFDGKVLADVNGALCRQYASERTSQNTARLELSHLRAAINHHMREGLHDKIVSVLVPAKPLPRERHLERDEAARLIRHAWRYREKQNGRPTGRRSRKHVAQFMLVARYFGSRASIICGASLEAVRPESGPWVDLVNGVFYGKSVRHRDSKKRRQVIRIPPPLLCHFRIWRRNGQSFVVEWRGGPIKRVSKAHRAAARAAGFARDVTPHTWRHSLATWLMQDGVDVWAASGYLAMSVETLTRVYGHHHPDQSGKVHDAFNTRRAERVCQQLANDKREQKAIPTHDNVPETPAKIA